MKTLLVMMFLMVGVAAKGQPQLTGAWKTTGGDQQYIMILSERQFSVLVQNASSQAYIGTYGGSWRIERSDFIQTIEFSTIQPESIGKDENLRFHLKGGNLVLEQDKKVLSYTRIDDGKPGQLAGAWLITGRMTDKGMSNMTPGARRTMKILSGTRFQWIAYNVETREFFGTGGGTYTTENGKYTEHIEFFSRDASRVGMNLQFDFAIEDGHWRHKGLSSKGEPIDERWTHRERIALK
ncbi:MAG: membrane or secreted protein [Bacteroidetes bacterium]|nr:membrane or secreted protein [Bacteroidota bacterium]